jgi:CheY-like chemotaxis protein
MSDSARWGAAAASPVESPDVLDGISVLVLDDNSEGREVVAAQLQRRRANVVTAESASHAIDILQRERVDVILADVAMPGEDGYAFIKRVRRLATSAMTPAAALTALATKEDRRRALDAGFQLHLAKPIDGETLIAAVSGLVRRDRG